MGNSLQSYIYYCTITHKTNILLQHRVFFVSSFLAKINASIFDGFAACGFISFDQLGFLFLSLVVVPLISDMIHEAKQG